MTIQLTLSSSFFRNMQIRRKNLEDDSKKYNILLVLFLVHSLIYRAVLGANTFIMLFKLGCLNGQALQIC